MALASIRILQGDGCPRPLLFTSFQVLRTYVIKNLRNVGLIDFDMEEMKICYKAQNLLRYKNRTNIGDTEMFLLSVH